MSRKSGIPLGCVVVMLPFALIWGGAQGVHEASAFPKPRVMTYAEFEKERPKEGWFTITTGGVTPLEASWMVSVSSTSDQGNTPGAEQKKAPSKEDMAKLDELYLPVHREDAPPSKEDPPVLLVLQTHSERTIHTVQQMAKMTREKGESETMRWLEKNMDRVWERRDFTGMLQVGINASSNTREELAKGSNLAPDFMILKEGERPQMGFAATMLGAGILMLLVPILLILGACLRKTEPATGPRVDEFVLPR